MSLTDIAPSPYVWTFTIPVDVGLLSPNKYKRNWRARAAVTRAQRDDARMVWMGSGKPRAHLPVRIDAVIYRYGNLDPANRWACLKAVIDGLCIEALTPNDTQTWIRLGEIRLVSARRFARKPAVVITATRCGAS